MAPPGVLVNFKADFELTMGLSGYTAVDQISRDALRASVA